MNSVTAPRPAATLMLVRDGDDGLQVLMVRRTRDAAFAGGAYVFPGGALDPQDHAEGWPSASGGLDDATASARLGIAQGGLGYWIAAIRESFEEAGLLLAHRGAELLRIDEHERTTYETARRAIAAGDTTLHAFVRERELELATERVHYFSHWITQAGRPRRFDTRFFIAQAPAHQHPAHDGGELVEHLWIAPALALERHQRGDFNLLFPTVKTLEALAAFRDCAAALDYARSPRPMPAMEPRRALGREGVRVLVPGDHAYAEVGKLDPDQTGTVSCEIEPGRGVRISARIHRITAPNPGVMTGPGTNTYLVGDAATGVAVIDPGPADEAHLDTLLRAAPGAIRWILCTHTHRDHSPGSAALKARTGARTYGMLAAHSANQDTSFVPDQPCGEGDVLLIAGCTLRVLHTPGHASNQLCFLLEEEGVLFTGDHIMQGSTVVINPPDGDMTDYFASLERLRAEALQWLAPGHGFLMARPHEMVERLLVHRRARENKVLHALRAAAPARVEDLVPAVYDDTPSRLHALAARSLLAHLLKLEQDGRVARTEDLWTWLR